MRISDVRLAADDEPANNGFFIIRWSAANAANDAAGDVASATVKLYWDLDQNPPAAGSRSRRIFRRPPASMRGTWAA